MFLSFDLCTSSFFALLQTSLPKEPLETIDASMAFDFSVSVCISNLFRVAGLLECLRGWRYSISLCEGFWFTSFRFYPWWVVKSPGEISFSFYRVVSFPPFLFLLYGPQVDPFFYSLIFLFARRMERGHEGVSTSQAGRRRGTPKNRLLQEV